MTKQGSRGKNAPQYSIKVGNRNMFPDSTGGLHKSLSGALRENMRVEKDFSRGSSGACPQNPNLVKRKR